MGVPRWNEGDLRLKVAIGKSDALKPALAAMHAKARDLVRRAKIAAARRGKPRPAHVIEAVRRCKIGNRPSMATRKKMSEAHKQRGTQPPAAGRPWTVQEDELLITMPTAEVLKQTGRTVLAIRSRRQKLALPDGRSRAERRKAGRST